MTPSRRRLLTLAAAFAARPVLADPTPPAPQTTGGAAPGGAAPAPDRPRVALNTAKGVITLALAADRAPLSCANFLRYVTTHRLDGASFYRASKAGDNPPTGLIQGGLGTDGSRLLPPVAHESTLQTGLHHVDGTISLARLEPGSARCEFFICVGPQPYLDADPTQPGDNLGFAAFGQVVDGMDVVRAILVSPVSPTEGEGPMKGQMLDPRIPILTARRL